MSNGVSAVIALVLQFGTPSAGVAQPSPGERVYADVSPSVLLIKMSDANGTATGTATGFLVGPDKIVTNAHVASAGSMSIALGGFEVPCAVEKIDTTNDLALCKINGRASAKPLVLADVEPKQGSTIYAVGNPRGLERTITEGLFTAHREIAGQLLAQISAPISPGSSGGPIVDAQGYLVGVAVASRGDGQNLNFAVPLSVVRRFLTDAPAVSTVEEALAEAKRLEDLSLTLQYSDDAASSYQQNERRILASLNQVISASTDLVQLARAYDLATLSRPEVQVLAARKMIAIEKRPSADAFARLAAALYWSTNEVDSPEILEAEKVGIRAVELGTPKQDDVVMLGHIQSQMKQYARAYATYQRAIVAPFRATSSIFHLLAKTADALQRHEDADKWFREAVSLGTLSALEYADYGKRLEQRSRYGDAALAYRSAFGLSPRAYRYVCDAGRLHWIADELDLALAAARECISAATSAKDAAPSISMAHRIIAEILNTRNVFDQAEIHAKEAIQTDAENGFAHNQLARSLLGQNRPSEAVVAARSAIRLTDGKYGDYHFTLGSALFRLKQFSESAQAFRKAAELMPTDSAAAYNVAVSYYNAKYDSDALRWYREALKRNPNSPNREEILRMIDQLSR